MVAVRWRDLSASVATLVSAVWLGTVLRVVLDEFGTKPNDLSASTVCQYSNVTMTCLTY